MVDVVKGKVTDKYDVGQVIGRGKFSTVKLCTEKESGREYAVKILRTARRGCSRDAILNEVRIMNMCVECTYVLKLVEVFDGGREFHLVEELAECGDLYSRCLAEENHAEESEVRHYIKQLLSALVFIHDRNIVHCDIKPENVLVTRDDLDNIRLVDFGLARVVSKTDTVCEIVGTTEYVAPEILSFEPITPACDLWSLGVLAYTLLSGISPFLGDSDSETYANISHCDYDFDDEVFDCVSEDAQNFISDLLEVKPRIRPSAHEISVHTWMTSTAALPASPTTSSTASPAPAASSAISSPRPIGNSGSISTAGTAPNQATTPGGASPTRFSEVRSSDRPVLAKQASVGPGKMVATSPSARNTSDLNSATSPNADGVAVTTSLRQSTPALPSTHASPTCNMTVANDDASLPCPSPLGTNGNDENDPTVSGVSVVNRIARSKMMSHVMIERAASLPTDRQSRHNQSVPNMALITTSGRSTLPQPNGKELVEGDEPLQRLFATPAGHMSKMMHRRSQSCRDRLPTTVLIERSDPEQSFTYLKEQAIRLSDKIQAIFLGNKTRQEASRTSPARASQSPGSSRVAMATRPLSRSPVYARTSTPTHGGCDTVDIDVFTCGEFSPASVIDAPLLPATICCAEGAENQSPVLASESQDGERLLKNFHIHIKSSASISGMRQLHRKTPLRTTISLSESPLKLSSSGGGEQPRKKCSSYGWDGC